jgi:hypothetical protein
VTTSESLAMWATVALCAAIAIWDPAERAKRWWRNKDAPAPGYASLNVERVEGAAPVVAAPSTMVLGVEVLCDLEIQVSDHVVLDHLLRQGIRRPVARA